MMPRETKNSEQRLVAVARMKIGPVPPHDQEAVTDGGRREVERHQEGRQGILPGLHHRAEGVSARDGRRRAGGEADRRGDLGKNGEVEGEQVRHVHRDADLDQGRRDHDDGHDVGRGDGQGEADQHRGDQGQQRWRPAPTRRSGT